MFLQTVGVFSCIILSAVPVCNIYKLLCCTTNTHASNVVHIITKFTKSGSGSTYVFYHYWINSTFTRMCQCCYLDSWFGNRYSDRSSSSTSTLMCECMDACGCGWCVCVWVFITYSTWQKHEMYITAIGYTCAVGCMCLCTQTLY